MAKIFDLLDPNYKELKATAAAALVGGQFQTFNEVNGFTLVDVANGADFALVYEACKVKVAKAAVAFAPGEALYYDESESLVTNVSTDNLLIGHANRAALAGDSHGYMDFNGMLAFAKA